MTGEAGAVKVEVVPILETNELTRRFGDLLAVDRVTLRVEAGQVFGLLGSNGAGKTTVIKMLTTLLAPTSGTATVAGFDVRKQAAKVRRVIGYVPQMISADGTLTGYENLLIFAKLYDIPRRERAARIADALTLMELTDAADRLVREYSGGMIRRLEIAQSMLHRPPVLFLDEPTVGLDPIARHSVWDRLMTLKADFNTTIFLTTHLMDEADALCHEIAILHRGRVAVSGSPAALKASVGRDDATMDDVFIRYAGTSVESGGTFQDVSRTRRTAQRVG
ncbi:MAG: ATP-binding cassette domain-containing protein [Acidobacteriia bacterium]|nr:ATP-binding cassette domain-containing protein [Terriglobia bacterium]